MVDALPSEGLSKSAKKRAAKKARDAAHAEEEEPAFVAVAKSVPKAKAKAAAQEPEPKAEPKGKAKGKAKAEAAKAPEPEPKAKAKAKAEPEPPAPEPKAKGKAKVEPQAKAQGKQKAKAQTPVQEEQEVKRQEPELVNFTIDDGSGPAWEVSSGLNKKQEKRKQKEQEARAYSANVGSNGKMPTNTVVGMAPLGAQQQAGKPKGPSQSVAADVERILAMKNVEEKPAEPAGNVSTVTITVPEPKIGICIGPKGSTIKMLTEKTGVSKIDTTGNIFTILGPPNAVAKCEVAIKELIEKGFCSLAYENFSENIMNVHPSSFPDLIGKGGAIVKVIKEELKVEVNFQDVPKGSAPSKKGKVTLAGTAANVEKAKEVINDIIMYGHHELTHPGQTHEELDVEEWHYRYIIGKAGSEMRHIQHNWKVKVNIPRETSANQKVIIVGEPDMVARAKAYVEKVIWNAENQAKGRDRADNQAGDPWGDEDEEETWMKPYLYKR